MFRSIHSNGGAANNFREQLDAAQTGQREAEKSLDTVTERIDASTATAQSISNGIANAKGTVDAAQGELDECQSIIEDSAKRYEESARILREIREGARTDGGTAANTKDSVADCKR